MHSASSPISSSEKTSLYLSAARNHLGLIITFILTLLIPLGGILIGTMGDELLLVPIVVGTLFFLIPYFILLALRSSISFYYETALINQFGVETKATVSHKSLEDNSYHPRHQNNRGKDDSEKIEEIIYYIDYKYTYGKAFTCSFIIDNKELYNTIKIGDEVIIKVLPSSPEKSAPVRKKLAKEYGFEVSDCQ